MKIAEQLLKHSENNRFTSNVNHCLHEKHVQLYRVPQEELMVLSNIVPVVGSGQ